MFGYGQFRVLSWAFGVVGVLFVFMNGDFDSAFNCLLMQLACGWCEYKWPTAVPDVVGNPSDKK